MLPRFIVTAPHGIYPFFRADLNITKFQEMSVTDTLFSCDETPVWTPATLNPATLPPCLSCTLRLSSEIAGPGTCSPTIMGLRIDENPMTEFVINGTRYNLMQADMTFGGMHRLYGQQSVSDAEVVITFRHITETSKIVLLCVPIVKSDTYPNAYFDTLGSVTRERPVLSSLIDPNTRIMSYPGASIAGRSALDPRPSNVCAPIAYPVTYYVMLRPSNISNKNFARLRALCDSAVLKGPPRPLSDITANRATRLLTHIQSITLEGVQRRRGDDGDGLNTKALKCYRLDPQKDIKGDKVYIGGAPNENTLEEELRNAADLSRQPPDDGSVKPGDIEGVVGIVIGVTIGVIVCATVAYYLWKATFTKYLTVQRLYNNPIGASKLSIKVPSLPTLKSMIC